MNTPTTILCFTDVLCGYSYVAAARLAQLEPALHAAVERLVAWPGSSGPTLPVPPAGLRPGNCRPAMISKLILWGAHAHPHDSDRGPGCLSTNSCRASSSPIQ